ncbi:hypothetical protein B1R27_09800 [Streptomyces sp. GKU 895]|nr:hypothetical protein B1R27_09800 [Streptomyces sp. GKU 895]
MLIADNTVVQSLDALQACERLRSLAMTGCTALTDLTGAAKTGVMFIEVDSAVRPSSLATLGRAKKLRELSWRDRLPYGDTDLEALRRYLPGVRVRVTPGSTG